MLVKFKKLHEDAVLPAYGKHGDAALDLTAVSDGRHVECKEGDEYYSYWEYKTGLAVEVPHGFVGLIFPRSSISKTGLSLCNAVGVLDSSFRGEVCLRFNKTYGGLYKKGDRIGQLMVLPYPTISPIWFDELSETERGSGGFGSTGR